MQTENETKLQELLTKIEPIKSDLSDKIQKRLDNLTKPQGSLGKLELFAKKYCLITNTLMPELPKKSVLVFAGDHGIVQDGVSLFPQAVTKQMVCNFINGGAGINVLARHAGADVRVIDMGVNGDFGDLKGLINKKIAFGTKNMTKEPAMTRDEAIKSILFGVEVAIEAINDGYDILATGDMGIGNTTPSSAITSVITGKDVEEVTGRGTGIDDASLINKISLIKKSITINKSLFNDPIGILSGVGGFEIGGIAGAILGAALMKKPVVIDGFISGAGAIIASSIKPEVRDYIFTSHKSVEKGHAVQLAHLDIEPVIDLDLRLGEGTGATIALTIIEAGLKIYLQMATFEEAMVSEKK
jgi:nicotinate-nucleotide--dimethylbenzimidazole phosphoribosyltransferase